MPVIGKTLQCKQERGNLEDLYAVSVMKSDTISGHVLVLCDQTLVCAGAFITWSISGPHELVLQKFTAATGKATITVVMNVK